MNTTESSRPWYKDPPRYIKMDTQDCEHITEDGYCVPGIHVYGCGPEGDDVNYISLTFELCPGGVRMAEQFAAFQAKQYNCQWGRN